MLRAIEILNDSDHKWHENINCKCLNNNLYTSYSCMNMGLCTTYEPRHSGRILESLETKNVCKQIKGANNFNTYLWPVDALTMFVAPQVSSLDIEMAMSLVAQNARAAMFPRVQTWWNLDVRSHKWLYKHTISDMHLPHPPPHTPKRICKYVYGIKSKKFDRGEQMRS